MLLYVRTRPVWDEALRTRPVWDAAGKTESNARLPRTPILIVVIYLYYARSSRRHAGMLITAYKYRAPRSNNYDWPNYHDLRSERCVSSRPTQSPAGEGPVSAAEKAQCRRRRGSGVPPQRARCWRWRGPGVPPQMTGCWRRRLQISIVLIIDTNFTTQ